MNPKHLIYRTLGHPRLLPAREATRDLLNWGRGAWIRVRRVLSRSESGRGVLSVVVPVYNVERYLEPMLQSVLRQRYRDLEVIIVDDGSTDRSGRIARRIQRSDPRVRLVRQQNAGLGAARNAGAALATGEYLTFVDSDDTVDRHAYRYTIETLARTGSDFAVSPYRRLVRDMEWAAGPWIHDAHSEERLATNIREYPAIQVNAVAWSKVYRTSFWRDNGLEFPEGVLYEDQPVSTLAYALAERVDVLTHPSVNWRVRDDGSSITQAALSVRNSRDHLAAALSSLRTLAEKGLHAERLVRLGQLLANDYSHMIPFLPEASDEEWREFVAALRRVIDEVGTDTEVWNDVPARNKIAFALMSEKRRDDLTTFLLEGGWATDRFPAHVSGEAVYIDLGPLNERLSPMPRWVYRLSNFETRLRSQVQQVSWISDSMIRITGHAVINNVDPARTPVEISAALVSDDGVRHDLDARWGIDPLDTATFATSNCDATRAYFEVDADVTSLDLHPSDWRVELTLTAGDLVRRRNLHDPRRGDRGEARFLPSGSVIDPITDRVGFLALRVQRPPVVVELDRVENRVAHFSAQASVPVTAIALIRENDRFDLPQGQVRVGAVDGRFTFALDIPAEPPRALGGSYEQRVWRIVARDEHGNWRAVTASASAPLRGERADAALLVERRVSGFERIRRVEPASPTRDYLPGLGALLVERVMCAEVQSIEVDGDRLVVMLSATGIPNDGMAVTLSSEKHRFEAAEVETVDGGIRAHFDLRVGLWGGPPRILPSGTYTFAVRWSGGEVVPACAGPLAIALPRAANLPEARLWMHWSPDTELSIDVAPPLSQAERSAYWQHQSKQRARLDVADRPVRDSVFFRCLYGEVTGDSAEAVHHELRRRGSSLELIWSTVDGSVPVPDGGVRVLENSAEFYRAATESKYVVVNVHQPDWFVRGPGQVVIQTMHGYPFKLAGRRHWHASGLSPARIASFEQRASEWDYFISPSAYATPLLEEFLPETGWPGTMLEIGYPRNDILISGEGEEIRNRTRRALGIDEDRIAVLYAPTYRDYLSIDEFRAEALRLLDVDEVASKLRSTHVLLVRGHVMNSRVGYAVSGENIIDVTNHPSIVDLTLASDAAILDYSSLRFDYALTGKPMLFFNPDQDRYFASREPMIPYAPTAPGPWLTNTREVIDRLRDLDRVHSEYAPAVREFRRTYMELEDGRAASRLVEAVFVPRGDA